MQLPLRAPGDLGLIGVLVFHAVTTDQSHVLTIRTKALKPPYEILPAPEPLFQQQRQAGSQLMLLEAGVL